MTIDSATKSHFTEAAIQNLCNQTLNRLGVTGAQVAIGYGDQLFEAASGIANSDLGQPVTPDTLFQIGSTTKVYTAVLLMQLADQGLIDIDEPVSTYLPGIRLAANEEQSEITPRQLMSMNSGLDNGPYQDTGRNDDGVKRYVDLLSEIPLTFAPGTAYGYSNASTTVSGLLIETLTGRPWDEVLRDRLLRPAGMAHSVSLTDELPYFRTAVGHALNEDGDLAVLKPWCFSRGMGPTGSSLAATAADVVRLGRLFLSGGLAPDATRLLSQGAVSLMQTPQVNVPSRWFADSWCVGPYRKVWDGVEIFGHSGTNVGGSSTLLWVPELDLSIAVTVNTPPLGYFFADAVFDTVFGDWLGLDKPCRPNPNPSAVPNGNDYAGTFESLDMTYDVTFDGSTVSMAVENRAAFGSRGTTHIRTDLVPISDDRFMPSDDAVTGHHAWDIAFARESDGTVSRLHNGAFTARRIK